MQVSKIYTVENKFNKMVSVIKYMNKHYKCTKNEKKGLMQEGF